MRRDVETASTAQHADIGLALQLISLDLDLSLLVRFDVQQDGRRSSQEIQVGEIGGHGRSPILASGLLSLAAGFGRRGGHVFPGGEFFLPGGRVADRPGIQQQFGARQHVAGELLGILALQDVAKFVPDPSSFHVQRNRRDLGAPDRLGIVHSRQLVKRVEGRLQFGGKHMDASGGDTLPSWIVIFSGATAIDSMSSG